MAKLYFLLLCLPLHLFAQTYTPPAYVINNDTATFQMLDKSYWQMIEDTSSGKWNIDKVTTPPLSNAFKENSANYENSNYPVNSFWVRFKLRNDLAKPINIALQQKSAYADFYILGNGDRWIHQTTGENTTWNKRDGYKLINAIAFTINPAEEIFVYERIVFDYRTWRPKPLEVGFGFSEKIIADNYIDNDVFLFKTILGSFFTGLLFFAAVFNFFFFLVVRERVYFYYALCLLFGTINKYPSVFFHVFFRDNPFLLNAGNVFFLVAVNYFAIQMERHFLQTFSHFKKWDKFIQFSVLFQLLVALTIFFIGPHLSIKTDTVLWKIWDWSEGLVLICLLVTFLLFVRKKDKAARQFIAACLPVAFVWLVNYVINIDDNSKIAVGWNQYYNRIELLCVSLLVIILSWILFDRYNKLRKENAEQALLNERLAKEKEMERSQLIAQQKVVLEKEVEERTAELKQSLVELKAAQKQLIHNEKMASLGQLTAGIAHEIQNPLNFVNNFSEVSAELLEELKAGPLTTLQEHNKTEADEVMADLSDNLYKIKFHGKRADAIVKAMLQHSNSGVGKKEPTDINVLTEKYFSVSYSGLISKDPTLHVTLLPDFDKNIGKIEVIQQDIGRVLINLFNNAFYSVVDKKKKLGLGANNYEPAVEVSTKKVQGGVEICVKDNGFGIPQNVVDKIFQPFFTTKPTGQGAGLGLYLSYDIVKAHGGELSVETIEGEGALFIITLPV
ncbi:MAG: integral rane sensor signal transduction histidine kinase [Segetibacter sp.]|nr:integral rane sensor signal transduction histidine kinase [Segetibacter sp.]